MKNYEKLSRKYKYRMKQKYQEDPFAFIVLWSLFFSAVFLIFAFRGLIAAMFMSKIDISNEIANNAITNETDSNTTNSVIDNSTPNSVVDNSNTAVNGDTTASNQTNIATNTLE